MERGSGERSFESGWRRECWDSGVASGSVGEAERELQSAISVKHRGTAAGTPSCLAHPSKGRALNSA
eukprot:697697-Pleurochrysis_carterae.AAC.1